MTRVQGLSYLISKMRVLRPLLLHDGSLSIDVLCGSIPSFSVFKYPGHTILLSIGKMCKFRKYESQSISQDGIHYEPRRRYKLVLYIVPTQETCQIPFSNRQLNSPLWISDSKKQVPEAPKRGGRSGHQLLTLSEQTLLTSFDINSNIPCLPFSAAPVTCSMKTSNRFQWLRLQRFDTECTENAYLCQIHSTLLSAIPFIITVIGFLLMSVYLVRCPMHSSLNLLKSFLA